MRTWSQPTEGRGNTQEKTFIYNAIRTRSGIGSANKLQVKCRCSWTTIQILREDRLVSRTPICEKLGAIDNSSVILQSSFLNKDAGEHVKPRQSLETAIIVISKHSLVIVEFRWSLPLLQVIRSYISDWSGFDHCRRQPPKPFLLSMIWFLMQPWHASRTPWALSAQEMLPPMRSLPWWELILCDEVRPRVDRRAYHSNPGRTEVRLRSEILQSMRSRPENNQNFGDWIVLTASCRLGTKHAVARCNNDINVVLVDHLIKICSDCFRMSKGLFTSLDRVWKVKTLLQ